MQAIGRLGHGLIDAQEPVDLHLLLIDFDLQPIEALLEAVDGVLLARGEGIVGILALVEALIGHTAALVLLAPVFDAVDLSEEVGLHSLQLLHDLACALKLTFVLWAKVRAGQIGRAPLAVIGQGDELGPGDLGLILFNVLKVLVGFVDGPGLLGIGEA